ncbi:2-oxoglutarate dehydrogenase, E2 component, dihydrolipoamide succinyltransferase [soil metagenome]
MPVSVTMPALGESVTEGTVTRWLKQEGEQVQADEPLLEVSTDKVDTEIPSPATGVLTKIKVGEDETVDVGTELAVIGDGDGADGDSAQSAESDAAESDAAESDAAESEGQQEDQREEAAADEDQPADTELEAEERADEQPAQAERDTEDSGPGQDSPPAAASPGPARSSSPGGMAVTMPALGESVTEGTVTRWLKQVGDEVAADEPLLEVSTDKVDTEIPSPASGTVLEISVQEDETVEVGTTLAMIGAAGEGSTTQAAPDAPEAPEADAQPSTEQDEPQPAEPDQAAGAADEKADDQADEPATSAGDKPESKPAGDSGRHAADTGTAPRPATQQPAPAEQQAGDGAATYVTPLVRKLAAEHGVDLTTIKGSGVGGRIRKQDVMAAAQPAEPEPEPAREQEAPEAAAASTQAPQPASSRAAAPTASAQALRGKTEKLSRLRAVIARRMVESLQISAQLTTVVEVDITEIARLRARVKSAFEAREGVKLSFLPFLSMAAVEALKVHPQVNSSVDMEAGTVTFHDRENLGVAVDTERGLLVPVIHDAGDLNLGGMARKIADLADRTRRNKITPDELSGGTFTLTNTGSRGALFDTPIINQPQSAILGTGTVVKRPVVVDHPDLGEIVAVRSMMYLALSYDHRIVDGADAARFLGTMKQRLEGGDFESALGAS